jgi:hypothetical protein
MIYPGITNTKEFPNVNEELLQLEGVLSDEVAMESFAKFLRYNLGFTINLMTGMKVFPFQEMIIRSCFSKDFFMLIAGRGLSKSFSLAMFIWLYAIFTPGSKIGIISKSFRQSQLVFRYIEEFAGKPGARLLKSCFVDEPAHGNSIWTMNIGSSFIASLPLGQGEKLRGSRFNVIVIDEFLLMPESVVNEVILPFISVNFDPIKRAETEALENDMVSKGLLKESERTVFSNPKFISISSAGYQFDYMYKLYKEYVDKIMSTDLVDSQGRKIDSSGYGVFQVSYEMAPGTLYNESTISKFKSQLSEAQFNREFRSVFTDDSGGFFSKRKMDLVTVPYGSEPSIALNGTPNKKYILAIDPSFSNSESSDHFAMGLFELDEENKISTLVHNYAVAGGKNQNHILYLAYLLMNFNIIYIIIDNAGHGFIDECNISTIFAERNIPRLEFFDADFDNNDYLEGLRNAKKTYDLPSRKICHAQYFNTSWIRKANESLAANIDHKRIWFAAAPNEEKFNKLKDVKIPDDLVYNSGEEKLTGESKRVDLIETQTYLIDLVKSETALIEVKDNGNGNQTFNLPQSLRRNSSSPDRARRDNYTTLLLGNWATKCLLDMQNKVEEKRTFTPFFIG